MNVKDIEKLIDVSPEYEEFYRWHKSQMTEAKEKTLLERVVVEATPLWEKYQIPKSVRFRQVNDAYDAYMDSLAYEYESKRKNGIKPKIAFPETVAPIIDLIKKLNAKQDISQNPLYQTLEEWLMIGNMEEMN